MPVLCEPSIWLPPYIISRDATLALADRLHLAHPNYDLARRLISNTGVEQRHLVQPIEVTLEHPGFEARNQTYVRIVQEQLPGVAAAALQEARLAPTDIDLIVFVSCTGFTMPSPAAWLINHMGFRSSTRQLPIAQLGCAAGGAALNRALDFCRAYPTANVLILAAELCSLLYQPDDDDIGSLLSNGLFGDAIAGTVVRASGGVGIQLERGAAYLIPDTESWISYDVRATGFHFRLDKRVPGTMEPIAPVLEELVNSHGWDPQALDFYIIHAGGPRILDDLCKFMNVDERVVRFSRTTLTQCGNIASATVLDALSRYFQAGPHVEGARGIIAGFGPGITAEAVLGTWTNDAQSLPRRAKASEGAVLVPDRNGVG